MPVITGSSSSDWLSGSDDADTIDGLGGQDRLDGAGGDDVINAGDGIDVAVGGDGADSVSGGLGDDLLGGGAGADTLNGGDGGDTLTGSGGAFRFYVLSLTGPEPLRFHIFGMRDDDGEVDILNGGAGNDFITVNVGDQAFGGDGVDQAGLVLSGLGSGLTIDLSTTTVTALASLIGATLDGFETYILYTTAFGDSFIGAAADDVVFSGDGADTLTGAGGADVFAGGLGADILDGGEGADRLYHDGGLNDRNFLTQSADDAAADQLSGGDGNDQIYIGAGDIADGGLGSDQLFASFYGSASGVAIDISGDSQAVLAGALGATLSSFEVFSLSGSRFNDILTGTNGTNNMAGDAGDDVLSGLDGTDVLRGDTGRDTLYGGIGNDQLFGSAGADTLVGGAGNDTLNGDLNGDSTLGWTTGPDTAVYSGPRSSYTITPSGVAYIVSGPEGTDTLIQIERIQFSDMTVYIGGGEIIDGDGAGNLLEDSGYGDDIRGGAGDDTIVLTYGADVVDGGDGFDTLDYSQSDYGGIDVRLDNIDGQIVSYGGGAVVTGVERIIGTWFDDSFRGDDGANVFRSGDGDDEIDGRGGSDTAEYDGARGDYDITRADGVITIVDRRIDVDQTDTVVNVEIFVFSDGVFTAEDLFAPLAAIPDRLQVTLGQASSLEAALLLGNDISAFDATVTAVRNAVGASVTLVDGRLVIVANAAEGSFEYVATGPDGEEVVGQVTLIAVGATAMADVRAADPAALAADLVGLAGNDQLTGGAGEDRLVGGTGNDRLDGGAAADLMVGGTGADLYRVDHLQDVVVEAAGEGTDTVEATIDGYVLAANVEKLVLLGVQAGTGNAGANTLVGNDLNNVLDGGAGADLMQGGAGNDDYYVDDLGDVVQETTGNDRVFTALASYTLGSRVERLVYTGTGDFQGTGSAIANALWGGAGNDRLDGGAGADSLRGGLGHDLYILDNAGDQIFETHGEGTDELRTSVSYALTGIASIELLTAAAGVAAINLTGNNFWQTLVGNDGANVLDGGAGVDTLIGGGGDDTFIIDAFDTVVEAAGGGFDTVRTTVSYYELAANVEQLILLGDSYGGYGNAGANVLIGTFGNNQLDGRGGADRMVGGLGDDQYVVDDAGDVVVETGVGNDSVRTALANYTLTALVENLFFDTDTLTRTGTGNASNNTLIGGYGDDTLNGEGGNDTLYGEFGADILSGGAGDDVLLGFAGADTLIGGLGNDTYQVDGEDTVIEAGVGIDTIITSLSNYTLGANVENLDLTTASAATGTGNALANRITGGALYDHLYGLDGNDQLFGGLDSDRLEGGAGDDVLDGGEGQDHMLGGAGDDTYLVDNPFDIVEEQPNEGVDTIRSAWGEMILASGVENVIGVVDTMFIITGNGLANSLTGAGQGDTFYGVDGNDKLFGLAGDDYLFGDDGADVLDGGTGADTMVGGLGNDIFIVDDILDAVGESDGEGLDTVKTSIETYSLAGYVETLIYTGSGAFIGYGNDLANTMIGGASYDTLVGDTGGDTLRGGAGDDSLYGGDDNDKLYGESGDDVLSGENGVDYLYGGGGADNMNGGLGKDFFVLSAVSDSAVGNRDVIELFESLDVVSLSAIDADTLTAGNQAFSFIGSAAFSGAAGQLRYTVDGEGGHLAADVNGDGNADLEILFTLGAPASLTAGNLIL